MLQWFTSFSEFTEFGESSAPFRKNSIELSQLLENSTELPYGNDGSNGQFGIILVPNNID